MELAIRKKGRGLMALMAGAALVLAACGDDPLGPGNGDDDDEGHPEPAGVVVTWGGIEIARYMEGDEVPTIELTANTTYPNVAVTFLDEDGEPLEDDEDVFFDVVIAAGGDTHVGWMEVEEHGLDAHLVITIEAREAGETTAILQVWHDDHVEWETPPVPVVVQESENGGNGDA